MEVTQTAAQLTALQQAGIVGGIIGGVVGLIQAILGWFKQRRESKIARAKFGYDLIDALFADQPVLNFLDYIDSKEVGTVEIIRNVLKRGERRESGGTRQIRDGIDWLMFHFDRMEHAISTKLTEFEVIQMPVAYYVWLLEPVKNEFLDSAKHIGYDRVVCLLKEFEPIIAKMRNINRC